MYAYLCPYISYVSDVLKVSYLWKKTIKFSHYLVLYASVSYVSHC